jgi:hypothetical protein
MQLATLISKLQAIYSDEGNIETVAIKDIMDPAVDTFPIREVAFLEDDRTVLLEF